MSNALTCSKCGEAKALDEFGKDKRSTGRQGRKSRCKDCMREDSRQWRKEHPDYCREYGGQWRKAHPSKTKAHNTLNHAVQRGEVEKPARCSGCGQACQSNDLHGHHEDYWKRLDVEWLCRKCHRELHKGIEVEDEKVS